VSRSGYSDDCNGWEHVMWRGAVKRAIRGKRGQALLKELETALLALPKKELCADSFASAEKGEVCALGAVALKRRLDKGMSLPDALKEIEEKYPEGYSAEAIAEEVDIAGALLKEITYINDESVYGAGGVTQREKRFREVLSWVQSQIKAEA